MTLPILPLVAQEGQRRFLLLEPLTPASFSPFGTAICPPFSSSLESPPSTIPQPVHHPHQIPAVFANQNSALKTSPISPLVNNYSLNPPSRPQMSMFSCFPRNVSGIGMATSPDGRQVFNVNILERHPYTTQTFSPLGLDPMSDTIFLVVVAPSLSEPLTATTSAGKTISMSNPPDLPRLRAFVGRGDQAVTYGPGTWHAPMVVIGRKRVDFVVSQFVNGVASDDCQEVLLGENAIAIDVDHLVPRGKSAAKL